MTLDIDCNTLLFSVSYKHDPQVSIRNSVLFHRTRTGILPSPA